MTMPKINLTDATATIIAAVIGAVAALLVAFISNSFTTEKFEQKISELETENAALKAQIIDLQKEPIANSETQVATLTKRISELEAEKASDKELIAKLEQENENLKKQKDNGSTDNGDTDKGDTGDTTPPQPHPSEVKNLFPYKVNSSFQVFWKGLQ